MESVTTVELRQKLADALGSAHFGNKIVHVSHHGKRYAAVISEGDAALLETIKSLDDHHIDIEELLIGRGKLTIRELILLLREAIKNKAEDKQTTS